MGPNYYLMSGKHIGKESASGYYCLDCKLTLCIQGEAGIHYSASKWHESCPKCGKKPDETFIDDKEKPVRTGVVRITSFRWALNKKELEKKKKIKNEYGLVMNLQEFKEMLDYWCPVQYYDMIGQEFR